jgi:hypothetical protein
LPKCFLAAFGYHEGRSFGALYWEPCGDKACYGCGLSDNWQFLGFVRWPEVCLWLDNGIHLGNSDETARHCLLVDAGTGEVHAASPRNFVRAFCARSCRLVDVWHVGTLGTLALLQRRNP